MMNEQELNEHRRKVAEIEQTVLELTKANNGKLDDHKTTLDANTRVTLRMAWGFLSGALAILGALATIYFQNRDGHTILSDAIEKGDASIHQEIQDVKHDFDMHQLMSDTRMGDRLTGSMFIEIQDRLANKNPEVNFLDAKEIREVQRNSAPYAK